MLTQMAGRPSRRAYGIEHRIVSGRGQIVREGYLTDAAGARGFGITGTSHRKQAEERSASELGCGWRPGCEDRRVRLAHSDGREHLDAGVEAMYGLAPGEFGRRRSAWEQLVRKTIAGAVAKVEKRWRLASRSSMNGESPGATAVCIGLPGGFKPSRTQPANRCA
jgi:hypothetical protein